MNNRVGNKPHASRPLGMFLSSTHPISTFVHANVAQVPSTPWGLGMLGMSAPSKAAWSTFPIQRQDANKRTPHCCYAFVIQTRPVIPKEIKGTQNICVHEATICMVPMSSAFKIFQKQVGLRETQNWKGRIYSWLHIFMLGVGGQKMGKNWLIKN